MESANKQKKASLVIDWPNINHDRNHHLGFRKLHSPHRLRIDRHNNSTDRHKQSPESRREQESEGG